MESSQVKKSMDEELKEIEQRLELIKHKILVLSGKGGVGKSTVAANLALSIAKSGKKVGLMDIDIHGPSVPKLLCMEGQQILQSESGLIAPLISDHSLKVMSIGFVFENKDAAVIWRGPMKYTAIKQFIKDVEWGELDYLIVDSPPGTGDEPLSIVQMIKNADGAVIVTTPQELAIADVRRSVDFCRKLSLPVLGVIENMSGFVCPKCGETTNIFSSGGGEKMADDMQVPFIGRIPLDPGIVASCDRGSSHSDGLAGDGGNNGFEKIVNAILK